MKPLYLITLTCCLAFTIAVAQKQPGPIHFRNGFIGASKNLLGKKIVPRAFRDLRYKNKYYTLLQFGALPDASERSRLMQDGIRLYDYLPGNAFFAELDNDAALTAISQHPISGAYALPVDMKLAPGWEEETGAEPGDGTVTAVSFYGPVSRPEAADEIRKTGAEIVFTKIQPDHVVFVHASTAVIRKMASLPFITYISRQSLKDVPLNNNNRAIHALDALSASSGRNLEGKNVVLGIGDNADPSTHVDFSGRLIQRNATINNTHGTHTTGTMAGAGILNPRYKGMAPKATIVSQYFSDIMVNAPVYRNDYNMVLTNNSYYTGANNCPGDGAYDVLSNYADAQLNAYPTLLHVFASGNDGALTCSPYSNSFATIKSGFQCGKDVLVVGNMNNSTYLINGGSSRGPVNDGRLKPEIVAGGTNIYSTLPNNGYGYMSGTSMSAPTVTGTLALLYERYRQLHAGADPSAALIKALACNNADDLGNPGPDFTYGFGMLNARTAVEAMERNQYFIDSIGDGSVITHMINSLPAGVQQLKVMLYWPDVPASPSAAVTLVNDLDLTVTSPDAIIHHPLILDPSPGGVNNNAVEGIDTLNNIEQVVINNPPAGNFNISVKGSHIPSGPQRYMVTYEIINPSVTVEYPFGNETFVPGETENIRWSAYGGDPNPFTVEYSTDNGASWTTISNSVPSTARMLGWIVPAAPTNSALVRISRNNTSYSDTSNYNFIILGQPSITVSNPCQGYAQLIWNTIPAATLYQVMKLQGDSMQVVATTTDTSYLFSGLDRNSSYLFSVAAVNNSTAGRRAIAATVVPGGGACALPAFANDFTLDSLFAPATGRQFTSSQLGNMPLQVEIKNLGNLASSGSFNISYEVNGGSIVTETSAVAIPAGSAYHYNFSNADSYDFSTPGTYNIKIWIDYPGDPQLNNDTLVRTVKQLQNDPVALSPTYTEGFETATAQTCVVNTNGFDGLDRCDFSTNSSNGRARTYINSGFARTGDRCVTLDQTHSSLTSSTDSLITTFNLSGYSGSDQIWLDYYYKNQGIDFVLPGNMVWIRGNDQAAWIPVDTLSSDPNDIGIYKASKSIDVTGILASAIPAQTVSSSFQIKFGEQGYTSTNSLIPDGDLDDGYSFDDISVTKSANDMSVLSLAQPSLSGICGLSNSETISIVVKNYSTATLTNVPITYAVNGDTVTETIPSVAAGQVLAYSFARKADLSAYQHYDLNAWVSEAADNYRKNDSLHDVSFQTTPVISAYPYLEGFENSNGYWYTQGTNDDWQWGTPTKKIISRAANGSKAWVTSLNGNYNDNQLSYLYSPCFDLSSLTHPVLSFSHIFQMEDDCSCDFHWVEYSTDDSIWNKLGTTGTGTNWYDDAAVKAWQRSDTIWHVSSFDIPTTAPKVRFRIVMSSDPATDYEGVGIDDIHIFDKAPVYSGNNVSTGLVQSVSGSNWIDFSMGGNKIVSINPNGQDLGNTQVKVFIDTGAIRDTTGQYYLGRNIVIQPSNKPSGEVGVRFYFLDSEANKLIHASGCAGCNTIHDAYLSGITQYSSPSAPEEDSTLDNNVQGSYYFLKPQQDVQIIPYDNGYYAEYQVNGFSEFWINAGGPDMNLPIAALLQSFTVIKQDNKGLLQWSTWQEKNITNFSILKSNDSINYISIGTVTAKGNTDTLSSYGFTDNNLWNGNNYYRLKINYADGHFLYSPVRVLNFNPNGFIVSIYPNPVRDILYINTSVNCSRIVLFDVRGRLLQSINTFGFQNSLSAANLAKGIYFITIMTDAGKRTQKIVVE